MTWLHVAPLRILTSYYYFQRQDLRALIENHLDGYHPDWFADSGAFTAYTQREEIDLNSYIDWLKKYNDLFTVYANLDVIGDADATYRNQQIMMDAGLNPLPVFHVGDDWSYLERYLLDGHQYIGLGGAVKYMSNPAELMKWFIRSFKIVGDSANLHGFGVTGLEYIKNLSWYSVDSTAWGTGGPWGNMPLFDPLTGTQYKIPLGDAKQWRKHRELVGRYGYKPAQFVLKRHHVNERNMALGGLVYRQIEMYIRDKRGVTTRKDDPNRSGLNLYLSNTTMTNFKYVYRAMRDKGCIP